MLPAGFEPSIPASEQPWANDLERALRWANLLLSEQNIVE